jgi:hypothetical protein
MTSNRAALPSSGPPVTGRQVLHGFVVCAALLWPLTTGGWLSILYGLHGGLQCLVVMTCAAFAMIWWRPTRGYAIGMWLFYALYFTGVLSVFSRYLDEALWTR